MQPKGRRGTRPPEWSAWELDVNRQLLRRTLTDYKGRALREQFGSRPTVRQEGGTELEGARDGEQTTAGVPRPSYGSAVRRGPPQPLDVASENEYSYRRGGTPGVDFGDTYASQDTSRGGGVPQAYGEAYGEPYYGTSRQSYMKPLGQQQLHPSSDNILSSPNSQILNRPQAPPIFPLAGFPAMRNDLEPSTFNSDANYRQSSISYESAISGPGNRRGQPHSFHESNNGLDLRSQPSNLHYESGLYGFGLQNRQYGVSLASVNNFPPIPRQRGMLDSGPESQQTGFTTEWCYSSEPSGYSVEVPASEKLLSRGQAESYYISITKPENWFKPGRIFNTNWTKRGEPFNGGRIFVVMREGLRWSECCLLQPYSLISVRHGYDSSICAVIFETGKYPQLFTGESRMKRFPVRIEKPTETIDPTLRLDFGTIYSIDHNAEVRNLGRIDRDYLKELKSTFEAVGKKVLGNTNLEEFQTNSKPTADNFRPEVPLGQLTSVDVRSEELKFEEFRERMMPAAETGFEMAKGNIYSVESKSRRDIHEESRNSPQSRIREPMRSEGLPIRRDDTRTKPKTQTGKLLDQRFQVHPSKDFKKGRVLMVLWSEPIGSAGESAYEAEMEGITPSKFGEQSYHSVRRFVILKTREGHSLCAPILTYGGRATGKPGVKGSEHAIIYSSPTAPMPLEDEQDLHKEPVRVETFSDRDKLISSSRVNYCKIYTIEHNIKVCIIGKIHEDSEAVFFTEVKKAFDDSDEEGKS